MLNKLQNIFLKLMNAIFTLGPAVAPKEKLQRLVAHRGIHRFNQSHYPENSRKSFSLAAEWELWGVECDLRWTQDNVPVIHHDSDLKRIFGIDLVICDHTCLDVTSIASEFCTLENLLQDFKGHLMLELKEPLEGKREDILLSYLRKLRPGIDYHLLSLKPEFFISLTQFSKECFMIVGELNIHCMMKLALEHRWGAVAGPYFLMSTKKIKYLKSQGLKVGTGFIDSRKLLYREMNRGVDYFFSNDMTDLKKLQRFPVINFP